MIIDKKPEDFDRSVEEMLIADDVRVSLLPRGRKNFHLIEDPWTMHEEPWVCRWYDKGIGEVCEVTPLGIPISGKKYTMFVTSDSNGNVSNYVFITDMYHFSGEDS